jgi:hypothetical protein
MTIPAVVSYAENVNIIPNEVCQGSASDSPACQKNKDDPLTGQGSILIRVTNVIAWLGGAIAVIMIIYASFTYVTSGGEQSKVKRAKDIILYAVVGLVVIVISRAIVIFVLNKFWGG